MKEPLPIPPTPTPPMPAGYGGMPQGAIGGYQQPTMNGYQPPQYQQVSQSFSYASLHFYS